MTEHASRWRIAVGSPVVIDGASLMVDEMVGGWVTLRAFDGAVRRMPLRELIRLVADDDAPPPLSERFQDVEHRLSEKQVEKLSERRAIVRWVETGLRPEQPADATPETRYDPEVVPDRRARIRAIAEAIADQRGIKVPSAVKHVNRLLDKATTGEAGLLDPRLVAPLKVSKHDEIEGLVREFLLDQVYRSTTSNLSKHVAFSAWVQREHGIDAPAKRTFDRALEIVYKRFPHLRQKAKSRESTAQAPKIATQRRFPMRVGEYWFIDATPSNVMLRDPYAPSTGGRDYRLTFSKVLDGASRHLVGRSFSEEANGYSAGLALADAFRRMHQDPEPGASEALGHPWPVVGLPSVLSRWPIPPRRLLLDNGREFLNKHGMWTLHRLGIDVEPQRVRDGRGKARLERHFGTNRTNFEEQQYNYIAGSIEGRGSESDSDVILTWEQLVARDDAWTASYNVTEHAGLKAETGRRISPAQRWIELAEEQGVIEVPAWRNEWIRFLPHQVVTLDPYGVTRRGLVYNAPIINTLIDVDGAAPSGKVRIFWDPADLRQVYCFDPAGNAYEVPWVYRTEDSRPVTDFTLDWANRRLEGTTRSRTEHQKHLVDLVIHWQSEDVVLLAEVRGRKNAQEILGSQLDAIRAADSGSIIAAERIVGQEVIDAMQLGEEGLELDEDDGLELLGNDDDLFSIYDD
ncbi:MAG: Mu transposase C-terminal domain-containing protein [Microbacterium sp.]